MPPLADARLDAAAILRALPTRWLGRSLTMFDSIDSTNTYLRDRRPPGLPHGHLVLAEEQTAGRGRAGRRWLAPRGACLLASLLLLDGSPPVPTVWATAAALADTVSAFSGRAARVKWPNDVTVNGRKIAGILAECDRDGALVVGWGLNVLLRESDLPPELAASATSLAMLAPALPPPRQAVLTALLERLEPLLDAVAAGRTDAVFARWRYLCGTLGRRVRIPAQAGEREGVAQRLQPDGGLVVAFPDGTTTVLYAGDVFELDAG